MNKDHKKQNIFALLLYPIMKYLFMTLYIRDKYAYTYF